MPFPPLERALDRLRAHPTGRVGLKITVAIVGVALVILGIILIPLPGPGWLIVIAGLAVLAIEYVWARHLLRYTKQQVARWTQWIAAQPLPVRLVIGLIGLAFVCVVLWASIRTATGFDIADWAGNHL